LPEVPSCRRSQNSIRAEEEECDDPSGFNGDNRPSLNCENVLNKNKADCDQTEDVPEFQLMYRHLASKRDGDSLPPIPVKSTLTPMPPFFGNMK
jgi:hypothetical protein